MNRTYVDIHILQTVPPSNINRDESGSPKQAVYGGARRARASSQSWKRATRVAFAEHVPTENRATRTKKISTRLAARITARTDLAPEAAARVATALLAPLGIKPGKVATDTAYLLFFGLPQVERLIDLIVDRVHDLAALDDNALTEALHDLPVAEQLRHGHPIDVALFGRMVADIPALNVDAATQVAHALSTHAVETEFDYFTAVDDDNASDGKGAGMIGTIEFNSSTLYRYATVGVHQLLDNLDGDTDAAADALGLFLDAFVTSMPAGHRNTFAHQTLPNLVSVVLRDDQPINLVSAFENPVRPRDGIVEESVRRLTAELTRATDMWGRVPIAIHSSYTPTSNEQAVLGPPMAFPDLVATVTATVRARLTTAPAA